MKKIISILFLGALLFMTFSGGVQAQEQDGYHFAFLNATMNNGFFVSINDKFEEMMEADGSKYTMHSSDWDSSRQISQAEDLVQKDIDLVFLTPADPDTVHPALVSLTEANIPIIILDNPVNSEDEEYVVSTVASDNYQAGVVSANMLMEDHPEGIKLAILTHLTNNASVQRLKGFKDTINKSKYTIVDELDTGGTIDGAIGPAEDVLQANPDISAIFSANELSGMGAISALRGAGKNDAVDVYAVDASPDGKELVVTGDFAGLAAQSPLSIAEKSYEIAKDYLNGKEVPEEYYTECFEVRKEFAEETAGEWQ